MTRPVKVRGVSASIGVAVGPARVLAPGATEVALKELPQESVEREVTRFERAAAASSREIEVAKEALSARHGPTYAAILDVYLLMHSDPLLIDATLSTIRERRANAEWALRTVVDGLKAPLLKDRSPYFRERARDIDHVQEHLLRHLSGSEGVPSARSGPCVLVARHLTPADAVHLLAPPTVALVTETGSAISHTAILARTYGVPAVAGTGTLPVAIAPGEIMIVDGFSGEVTIGASDEERLAAEARQARFSAFLRSERATTAKTQDGETIVVSANIELPNEVEGAIHGGAEGVGLYRTEFMCLNRTEPPPEDEQAEVYRQVASALAPNSVVFRTFDWRDDKRLRADHLDSLARHWLKTQVRAVLKAQAHGTVSLMFPMIATLHEFLQARALVDECVSELGTPSPEIGMMVELPSAALLAEQFAERADFFAIGTNDLVQYTLGLDRNDHRSAALASPLNPSVLDLISKTQSAAARAGIPCSMCGNMAADPVGLAVALGLGTRHVSVPVSFIPVARAAIRAVDLKVAASVAREAIACDTAEEVRALAARRFGPDLEALGQGQTLDRPR
ncbi:MAG: phosphoenolpyruvate--protein phosphotransferase [Myxococcota bacterium]